MTKLIATALAAGCLLAGCQPGDRTSDNSSGNAASPPAASLPSKPAAARPSNSILETLSKSEGHSRLAKAVTAAGLTETLSGAQPYTLFAPTDDAFGKLPAGEADALLAPESKGRLTLLLTNHIVPGTVTAQDLARAIDRGKGKAQLATVGGSTLSFTRSGDAIIVGDGGGQARLVRTDQMQTNGVVHDIDSVLTPAAKRP